MRLSRSQNRLIVFAISLCCSVSLYALFLKVHRVLELSEMDRQSESISTISSVVFWNSSIDPISPSAQFLIHSPTEFPQDIVCLSENSSAQLTSTLSTSIVGPSNLLRGRCETVEGASRLTIDTKGFAVDVEPPSISPRESAVCIGLAVLYEDVSTLRAILNHYSRISKTIVIYAASMSEDVMQETRKHDEVEVEAWPMLMGKSPSSRDELFLDAPSHADSVAAAFADCWIRFAPWTDTMHMVDLSTIRFVDQETTVTAGSVNSLLGLVEESWAMNTLYTSRVVMSEGKSVTLSQLCHSKENKERCIPFKEDSKDQTPQHSLVSLKKTSTSFFGQDSYKDAVTQCTSYTGPSEDSKLVMKLGFGVGLSPKIEEPCRLTVRRAGYKCRVAIHYAKKMFKDKLKVNVVHKRTMLRYTDGCHL